MKKGADWLGWWMQFIFGLVFGALMSLFFIRGSRRGVSLVPVANAPMFILGLAFVGGALASHFGDEFWGGGSYRIIPPDDPKRSFASQWASLIIGCVGLVLALIALARSLGYLT